MLSGNGIGACCQVENILNDFDAPVEDGESERVPALCYDGPLFDFFHENLVDVVCVERVGTPGTLLVHFLTEIIFADFE